MNPVSVCIITKNEEAHIGECIDCLRRYLVHIIVCDTGSTDHTVSIAKDKADKVIYFEWIDDFSAARNASILAAPTDDIFIMDADERLLEMDFSIILDFFKNHPQDIGAVMIKSLLSDGGWAKSPVPRLFNRNYFKYRGGIHEYLMPIDADKPGYSLLLPIELLHYGYAIKKDQIKHKMERNRGLLFKELDKFKNDAVLTYHLGATYYEEGNFLQCEEILLKVIDRKAELGLLYQVAVLMYGFSLLHLKKTDKALALEERAAEFSDFADFSYFLGQAYLTANRPLMALKHFLSATLLTDFRTAGTNSFLSYYHIGWIYEHMGEKEKAVKFYSLAANDYEPARKAVEENS